MCVCRTMKMSHERRSLPMHPLHVHSPHGLNIVQFCVASPGAGLPVWPHFLCTHGCRVMLFLYFYYVWLYQAAQWSPGSTVQKILPVS